MNEIEYIIDILKMFSHVLERIEETEDTEKKYSLYLFIEEVERALNVLEPREQDLIKDVFIERISDEEILYNYMNKYRIKDEEQAKAELKNEVARIIGKMVNAWQRLE